MLYCGVSPLAADKNASMRVAGNYTSNIKEVVISPYSEELINVRPNAANKSGALILGQNVSDDINRDGSQNNASSARNGTVKTLRIKMTDGKTIEITILQVLFLNKLEVLYPDKQKVVLYLGGSSSSGWGEVQILGADENELYFGIKKTSLSSIRSSKSNAADYFQFNWRTGNLESLN